MPPGRTLPTHNQYTVEIPLRSTYEAARSRRSMLYSRDILLRPCVRNIWSRVLVSRYHCTPCAFNGLGPRTGSLISITSQAVCTTSRITDHSARVALPARDGNTRGAKTFILIASSTDTRFLRCFHKPRTALSLRGLTATGRYGSTRLASAADALCSSAPSENAYRALRLTRSPAAVVSAPVKAGRGVRLNNKKTE